MCIACINVNLILIGAKLYKKHKPTKHTKPHSTPKVSLPATCILSLKASESDVFQVSGARYLLLSKLHLRVASHHLGTPGLEFFGVDDQHDGGDGTHPLAGDEVLIVAVHLLIFLDNLKH